MILRGEAYERLGLLDSAYTQYDKIVTHYSTSSDTMVAQWRKLYINAIQSDEPEFDSTMRIYINRVIKDMAFNYDTTGGGKIPYLEAESKGLLDKNVLELKFTESIPNPFSDKTETQYFISEERHITIILYDIFGRPVRNLYEGKIKKGWHSITVEGNGLLSGIYLIMIKAEDKSVVRSIIKM
mgnify:FL=1